MAYNDAMRTLLQAQLLVSSGVPTCEAFLRHLVCNFMCRLDGSENSITEAVTNPRESCFRCVSRLREHWRDSLFLIL